MAPRLPRPIYADLRSSSPAGVLDRLAAAYAVAGEAMAAGDLDRALEVLVWAKSVAPRSSVLREALGVARYLSGDFAGAHSELLAYRRLSGRNDQNHLLADCARAAGRHDKVAEYVAEMDPAADGRDRVAEGLIVLAGDRADRGDLRGALAALERAEEPAEGVEAHHVRVWYAAADIAERMGDQDRAREYLEAIVAVDPDFLDAAERLRGLG